MITNNLSLYHLARQPKLKSEKPPLLMLLHGVGSNERDLFGLAPYLDERFLILSVRSPMTLGEGSYGWWRVDFTSRGPQMDPTAAIEARETLLSFVEEAVVGYEADPARVYLMGFSQGAVNSMSALLAAPEKLAGVVAMSGRVLPDAMAGAVAPERFKGLPLFIAHGLYDDVLPIEAGRAARDFFSTLPVDLTYREYPMAHTINEESFEDARGWLSEQLDRKTANG